MGTSTLRFCGGFLLETVLLDEVLVLEIVFTGYVWMKMEPFGFAHLLHN
jgi:hypothetical protein